MEYKEDKSGLDLDTANKLSMGNGSFVSYSISRYFEDKTSVEEMYGEELEVEDMEPGYMEKLSAFGKSVKDILGE